ncbi:hypothetical protein GPX89_38980 [Nocardia sp. ET3-3]|uniref:Ig-like domain repeat protein n=1 Tax=Nocardia terrae TaxID=2675851 RepID=A0A7K1V9S4_9NOCA|nr:hypothetical protein [Nocardia terrae]MVU83212.1 hypothetical protein [Nocardia terrae]
MTENTARRVGLGATSLGALVGTIVLAAPQAGAWPSDVQVSDSSHSVGCTYTVTATLDVDRLLSVSFQDNGVAFGGTVTPNIVTSKASVQWTPSTAGSHTITAIQDFISKSVTVQVDPQSAFGSFGCGPSGILSGGSGVLNSLFPSISG